MTVKEAFLMEGFLLFGTQWTTSAFCDCKNSQQREGNMEKSVAGVPEFLEANELELLTDMLMLWCRKHQRDPDELIPKCRIVLERYKNGDCNADSLFEGL
jgi:hypothetical protein